MAVRTRPQKKIEYFEKLHQLVEGYRKILIVTVDNVGSRQMAEIRYDLRGKAVVLMGKNTMIRTALREMSSKYPELKNLIGTIRQNVGLIFCIADSSDVRKRILENKVPAPARQGSLAPCDVIIPAGPTPLDPGQTSFFQALGIATKLVKGRIEIQSDVHLIKQGDKVNASQSILLKKLNITPFSYSLIIHQVYDNGYIYNASVLDITDADILSKFQQGVSNVAALSRGIGLPNEASITHSILEGYKHCVAIALDTEMEFDEMKTIKTMLENPTSFAQAAPVATSTEQKKTEVVEDAKDEESEEEGGFGGLFDD